MDGAPLNDDALGDQPFGAPMPRAFRLADAERIAASRLEGAAEGSLKEALATTIVPPAAASGNSLTQRLQQIAVAGRPAAETPAASADHHEAPAGHDAPVPAMAATALPEAASATADPTPPRFFQAAPEATFGWMNAVPPAHAVPFFEDRDRSEDVLHEAAAMMPAPATASGWATAWPVATPHHDAASGPSSPHDLGETPAMPEAALHSAAEPATEPSANTDAPSETVDGLTSSDGMEFSDTPDEGQHGVPAMALPDDPSLEPIVTAYAASARLAADAAAASQALFELQKLLNDQLLEASPELNQAMEAHGFASLDAIPVAGQPAASETQSEGEAEEPPFAPEALIAALGGSAPRAPEQASLPPVTLPPVLRDVPPEELPKCVVGPERPGAAQRTAAMPPPANETRPQAPIVAEVTQARRRAAGSAVVRMEAVPRQRQRPQARATRPQPSRRQASFDFRGFAAGFALSGAIGVVLYFALSTS